MTIISGPAGNVGSRPFGGPQPARDGEGTPGLFASVLKNRAETAPSETGARTGKAANANGRTETTAPKDSSGSDGTDQALAASLDLQAPDASPADPAPMVGLVEALTALKASLDSGATPDPELLARVEEALTSLADALGLNLAELPLPEDFAALLEQTKGAETGLAGALNLLLGPLADPAAANGTAAHDQVKALTDKLAALLAALEAGAVREEKLAASGMKPGAPMAEEIETALGRFAATLSAAIPEEPALAPPSLKASEPVLTGKPAQAEAQPAASGDAVRPDESSGRREDRPAGTEAPKPQAAAGLAEAEADVAPPASAQAQQQDAATIRIEAGPRVVQAGYQTSQQQLNLPQLAFELARQVQDGNTRFQIRLDPPELGRIDVRLDIDKAGQVHARLTVEKAETLDLMQRDQRALERALQQAGLDGNKTSLEFSLKQNPFAGQDRQQREDGPAAAGNAPAGAEADEVPPIVNLYRGSLQASGVNIIA
ncbi:hypothetical protein A3840_09680 [Devosia elaeis]|uniref:Flagellar hook-length control protein-like C-terminal domain-containing protein n=1 Tax=Devosia elaeis TaxID=1770058 RepID=A0A178HYE2_9HYPH|nr:hypothetical protein A3840_09680 [Devosia elaeis]